MTIGEQAKAWFEQYERHEGKNSFAATVVRCLLYGLVVKREDFFVMAEPVFTDGKRVLGFAPNCPVLNCWWCYYATAPKGTTTTNDFIAEAPYALPFIGFKRRGKTKIYTWDHLRKDAYGRRRRSPSTAAA